MPSPPLNAGVGQANRLARARPRQNPRQDAGAHTPGPGRAPTAARTVRANTATPRAGGPCQKR
eukprot:10352671-Lingulodinium_polyedra.AAC.1